MFSHMYMMALKFSLFNLNVVRDLEVAKRPYGREQEAVSGVEGGMWDIHAKGREGGTT